ncbi:hypothetical protein EVU91_04490 [Macrococcoides bohemicum]|uniref:hypothetical protein n=1 Tax=Macrococcoides bohemicum TaxID=1903056 RepID=UPI001059B958|nr:hypothetical protein [Macrococcus bohemicus]TDL39407.1 hypothetical protein EVU91_04490 [Macrococcus bohemicus]
MNTIELDGQVFDLVPRKTIIEERQQTFTPPHDVNSEVKGMVNIVTPRGEIKPMKGVHHEPQQDYSDVNNILDDFKACLQAQNEKGIKKYGTNLTDAPVSILDLSNHTMEEVTGTTQYNRVQHYKLLEVIELLEQEPPQVDKALILLRGDADETTV